MNVLNLHPFILRRYDPLMGSPVAETRVLIADVAALVLDLDIEDDAELEHVYTLEAHELALVGALCVPPAELDSDLEEIHRDHRLHHVPYLVHTNYELPLMLEGRKQLASFSDVWPCDHLAETIGRFAPYVTAGRLICRIVDEPALYLPAGWDGGELMIRRVLYALPGEEWRIDAYLALWRDAGEQGWTPAHERLEGELFGYEDWQNDWWQNRPRQLGHFSNSTTAGPSFLRA